jgi:hypothetical protein
MILLSQISSLFHIPFLSYILLIRTICNSNSRYCSYLDHLAILLRSEVTEDSTDGESYIMICDPNTGEHAKFITHAQQLKPRPVHALPPLIESSLDFHESMNRQTPNKTITYNNQCSCYDFFISKHIITHPLIISFIYIDQHTHSFTSHRSQSHVSHHASHSLTSWPTSS